MDSATATRSSSGWAVLAYCSRGTPLAAPSVPVRRRMAVGAQESKVLDPVVPPPAVDVVDLQGKRAAPPDCLCAAQSASLRNSRGRHRPLEAVTRNAPGPIGRLLDEEGLRGPRTPGFPAPRRYAEVRCVDSVRLDPTADVRVMSAHHLEPEMPQYLAHVRRGSDRPLKDVLRPLHPLPLEVRHIHPESLHPPEDIPPRGTPRIHPQPPQRLRQRPSPGQPPPAAPWCTHSPPRAPPSFDPRSPIRDPHGITNQ
ncbi:hypothetical protein SUDANB52_05035 [Streptomyces sp. SudanB52_2052]